MKLNLYLCKKDIQEFDECLRSKTQNRHYELLSTLRSIDEVEYQIYIVKGKPKKPTWLSYIESYVQPTDINDVNNQTCSMVILFKLQTTDEKRIFALCHGFGYHIIDKEKIEQNFGLITTLNSIDHNKIKSMDTRSLGVQTIQKKEASNLYTNLGEFTFEFESEILQTISGSLIDQSMGKKIGGTDNVLLSTSRPIPLDKIPSKCLSIYEKFKLSEYKKHFSFVDYIKHEKNIKIIASLDNLLVEAITKKRSDLKISVAYPDQINYEGCDIFKFSGLDKAKDFKFNQVADITLQSVYNYIENDAIDIDILKKKVKIIGLDSTNEPITTQESLYTYLVFETDFHNNKYILSNKKWYIVENDYLQGVENELNSLVIPLSSPLLKPWPKNFDEGKYNEQYLHDPSYLYLDKQNFSGKNYGRSKIEIADLFHEPTRKLFFVKKLNRSATLSHLFSQATVSANLFKESNNYQEHFLNTLRTKWSDKANQFTNEYLNSMTFVYAVGTPHTINNPVKAFPVFSKINLLRHLKLLRKFNYQVEVANIGMI